ncbi:pyruvate, water dikinase regulatory protein [Allofustis seminis]|uniref:pyruvate, water dikinase regulatory protein n=1 Tax=Allofustis seminis TaxID=166939 RepID=UPI000381727B|nr:pyruvate, water dikinase regulatory protein [Allofustis seminis]
MPQEKQLKVYILCDAVGQSTTQLAQAALNQFPNLQYATRSISFVLSLQELHKIMNDILKCHEKAIIFHTFYHSEFSKYVQQAVKNTSITAYDVLHPLVEQIAQTMQAKPVEDLDQTHELNDEYFDRIGALEFAVINDDGKNPSGFLEADLVILGVSRTSKTPLSIYLANQNYKVANLPLLPDAEIPNTLWEVDPHKIIGLTSDLDILLKIRKERLESYGISNITPYSCEERVQKELSFAMNLYEKLGCKVINVTSRSIEETASLIIKYLNDGQY